jgi:ribosomal protein L14E/L6E/L27E
MEIQRSDLVKSKNGRDAGKVMFVLKVQGEYALIADGRCRRVEKPKLKKLRHLMLESKSESRVAQKIRSEEKVLNSELRRALAEYLSDVPEAGGGM